MPEGAPCSHSALLSYICLIECQSLGQELPLDEGGPLDQLIAKIDSDQDGKVNFQDFLNYMEKLNSDADTPDQINEAFTVVAGGKEYAHA